MIGQIVHDRYRVLDQLGQDQLATTYLARDQARNDMAVVKIVRPDIRPAGDFLARFRAEADKLARLTSAYALQVRGYGQSAAAPYVVFEYPGGQPLADVCHAEGALPFERALDVARQLGLCLADAHAHDLLHRNLRPAAIWLMSDGAVRVMDFGLAWAAHLGRLLAEGRVERDAYHAPELAAGAEADARADLYALGAILFELLAGAPPPLTGDPYEAQLRPGHLKPDIPPEVDDLVARCLACDPQGRPQNAAELLEGIDAALRGTTVIGQGVALGVEDRLAGHTLGAYRMVEKLGRGGMATVYKAFEPSLDRYVAVKVLPRHFAHDAEFLTRFRREARAVARLNHPNIVPVFSFGEEGDLAYIVMRYVEGGTLKDLLGQPMPPQRALKLAVPVARALSYAHRQGVVHRDVKPANVLLAEGDWPLLSDFGLARMIESSDQLTQTGVGVGTPTYMSPEQGQGLKVDGRSDIYSLGIVLYEMLTGQVPFQADTPLAVVLKHINAPLPMPRQVNPAIPEPVERILLKATAKDPAHRYQTAEELIEALERALAGLPAEAAPMLAAAVTLPSPPSSATQMTGPAGAEVSGATEVLPAPRPRRRLPAWALGLVAALAVVGLAGAALAFGLISRGRPATPPAATFTRVAAVPPTTTPAPPHATQPAPGAKATKAKLSPTPMKPVSLALPSMDAMQVKPCAWDGLGPGLCITPLRGGQPVKILQDTQLGIDAPSWSPDGKRIAFTAIQPGDEEGKHQKTYVVNADGSGLTQLTPLGNDVFPGWSPDGEWLALHSNCELAIMRPDGSDASILGRREPGQCFLEPEWSPDGQWIVASAPLEGDGQWSFPMTRQVLRISRDGQTRTTLATIVHENKDCTRFEVAFSPDGKQVAYVDGRCQARLVQVDGSGGEVPLNEFPIWWTSAVYPQWGVGKQAPPTESKPPAEAKGKIVEHCPDAKPPQLCVREVPSEQVTQVTDDLSFEAIFGSVWSPDGQQIVFDAGAAPDAGRHDHKLYLINADGSGLKPITGGDTNDLMPAWSPDGEWIAFHRNCALWRIRPNGAEARMLLPGSDQFCAAEIVWSPDSQRIALLNTNEKTPWEVWGVNREGADQRLVHVFEQRLEWAQVLWSPDGGQLAVWYQDAGGVQGRLINADGSGQPQPIQEYERIRSWYPSFWPPWGGRLP